MASVGALAGCGDLKSAQVSPEGGPAVTTDGGTGDPTDGATGSLDGSIKVTVETLVSGRSKLGARSTAGYRPRHTGIAATAAEVFWVESGTSPGLYKSSAVSPCAVDLCILPADRILEHYRAGR